MTTQAAFVEVDHQAFNQALSRLARVTERPEPVLRGIGEYLRNSTSDRFSTQTDPEGRPWTPLSEDYKARKERNADKILTLGGYLRKIVFQVEGDMVLVGSPMEYAAIHQFGGTIRPKSGKALAFGGRVVASVTIPARPYLGVSDADAAGIEDLVSDYLAGALDA